ncbi:MAG: oligosaccharide flippase family protein [Acidobacteriota bacterium]
MPGMTFRRGVTLTLTVRALTILVGLVSSIVTARWLGPEGRGLLVTLSVLTGLALQFGNLGLHSGNIYFVAREPSTTPAVLGNSLWLSLLLGIAGGGAIAALGAARPAWFAGLPYALILVSAAALPFQFMIFYFQNTLLGLKDVRAFNAFEAGLKVVSFASLAVYLIGFSGGPRGAVVILAIAAAAGGLASVVYCARRHPFRPGLDAGLLRRMIPYGGRVYLSCLLSYLVIRVDMLLVNYFLGTDRAGVYSITVQIADVLLLLPATIGMILMPRIAAEARGGRDAGAARRDQGAITARVSRHAALLMTLVCGATFFLVDPLVGILYGEPFRGAVPATRWLLPGLWALGMNGILMNHFAGQGLPRIAVISPLCGVALNLGLNLVLIPAAGIVGAAIASSAAYAAMFALALAYFVRSGRVGLRETFVLAPREFFGLLGIGP